MGGPITVSDRGDGKLIAKTHVDGKPVQVYRTRRGTITIEVGDQPIYGLSTEGANLLVAAIVSLVECEKGCAEFTEVVQAALKKSFGLDPPPDGWVPPAGLFPDQS